MFFKAFLSVFTLLISYAAALNIVDFPAGARFIPGSSQEITLQGNDIAAGDKVRVELWDNVGGEDVEVAVLADEAAVGPQNRVRFNIPEDSEKTKNAFLRIYFKCFNAVSPRFNIKPECLLISKQPNRPDHSMPEPGVPLNTPRIIYPAPTATPGQVIHAPQHEAGSPVQIFPVVPIIPVTPVIPVVPVITVSPTSTATHTTTSSRTSSASTITMTSTSSATTTKFSFGSLALAVALGLSAMLL